METIVASSDDERVHLDLADNQCDQMLKLKEAQIVPKEAKKINDSSFYLKGIFFKISQKYILANLLEKYFVKNFQKSPNLVTLLTTISFGRSRAITSNMYRRNARDKRCREAKFGLS